MFTFAKSKAATYAEQYKAEKAKAAAPQRAKKTVVEDVVVKPVSAAMNEDIKHLFSKYKIAMPSGTRVVLAFIASFCVGGIIGYVGGSLLELAVVGAMSLTGSLFLSVAAYILGVIAILYTCYKAGGWVGGFIMSGDVDLCYQKCSNRVRGFFTFGNCEVTT